MPVLLQLCCPVFEGVPQMAVNGWTLKLGSKDRAKRNILDKLFESKLSKLELQYSFLGQKYKKLIQI